MAPVNEPNLYYLSGDGIEIQYSTSSFAGSPQFQYRSLQHDETFTGDGIQVTDSPIGTLVTVTLAYIPDKETLLFTLLLPRINLNGREVSFATLGILTTERTSIGGQGLVKGAVQSYDCVRLEGSAQQVDFLTATSS